MEKLVKISNKTYQMKSSALTQFSYKDFTGRSFLKDLQSLTQLKSKKSNALNIDELDGITEMLLQITYILIKEADKENKSNQVIDYDSFLSNIDNLYDDENWIYEVLELACMPISRQLQINK